MAQSMAMPPERIGYPAPAEVARARDAIAKASAAGTWKTRLTPCTAMLDACEALHFAPEEGAARATILMLHGGGFRQGAPELGGLFHEAIVRRCGVAVFSLRYRLAPEFPFPAGLADAWAALQVLRARYPDRSLLVCGDSAGGGLAAGLGVLSAAQGQPVLDGVILLSPWLDLTLTATTYATNAASDPLFSHAIAETAAQLYLQGESPRHPLVSPLLAELAGYPPSLTVVGSGEVLLDDSTTFHAKLRAAGRASILHVIEGMDHVSVTRDMALHGSAECFEHVVKFVDGVTSCRLNDVQ